MAQSGPLGALKDFLYELYLEAGPLTLDELVARVAGDDSLPGAPERDTIRRCIGSSELPSNQQDLVSIVTVLARAAHRDARDAVKRAREWWVQAKMAVPVGWLINEVPDPFALEVHPAIDAGAAAAGLPVLPHYIRRDHDDQLDTVVQQAAAGRSVMALLVGGSSTGKTRACWEAVQVLPAGWRLWHPIDPGRPEAILAALPRIGARTVLWLNETQYYLYTPSSQLGEQVAAALRELLRDSRRGPVLILGTMWPDYLDLLRRHPPGQPRTHSQADALVSGTEILVPASFDENALSIVSSSADPRLRLAHRSAGDGEITQFLAGVPELLRRYTMAPPGAKALIEAAIDARRLGERAFLDPQLLAAAASGYISQSVWAGLAETWLNDAFDYATAPCRGIPGPLSRCRPESDEPTDSAATSVRLTDYLAHRGLRDRADICPPGSFWSAAATHIHSSDTLLALAEAAHCRGRYRIAEELFRRTTEHELGAVTTRAEAFFGLAEIHDHARHVDRAIDAYWRATELGHRRARQKLAITLELSGDPAGAEALAWMAIHQGEPGVLIAIARTRWDAEDHHGARELIHSFASVVPTTMIVKMASAWRYADPEGAEILLYCVEEELQDDPEALRALAEIEWVSLSSDEVQRLVADVIDAGDNQRMVDLARARTRAEDFEAAVALYRPAASAGHADALEGLARCLLRIGDRSGAREAIDRFADVAADRDQRALASLLWDIGEHERAERLFRTGRPAGLVEFAEKRWAAGDHAGAREIAAEILAGGNPMAVIKLAASDWWITTRAQAQRVVQNIQKSRSAPKLAYVSAAWRYGRDNSIAEVFHRAAARSSGYPEAISVLCARGQVSSDDRELWTLLMRQIDGGDRVAVGALVQYLRSIGKHDQAEAVYRYGLNADGAVADGW